MRIPFNKPYLSGKETEYIIDAVSSQKISGNGNYTRMCHDFFVKRYGFKKTLLTTSCTDALEMSALLVGTEPGDEVIVPSYTFVSTANAFVIRGANIIFADSEEATPNIDSDQIERLITPKTKAIVVVHYAGMACEMDKIMKIANDHNLFVIEDAAQAIDSFYNDRPLGSIGHLATFSYHETKNINCGEGGMIVVNDMQFSKRSEILWEKGTNRAAFFRGEVEKYNWVDIGSSFLPSELNAAYLYAQLQNLTDIQKTRVNHWNRYYKNLGSLFDDGKIAPPIIPEYATNNGHIFYVMCRTGDQRDGLLKYLNDRKISAVFHYLPLHESPFYTRNHTKPSLPNSTRFSNHLLRLPMYYELSEKIIDHICTSIYDFFDNN